MLWTMLQQNLPRTLLRQAKTTQSLGAMPPVVYPSKVYFFFRKICLFYFVRNACCFGLYFKIYFKYNLLVQVYGRAIDTMAFIGFE